MSPNWQLLIYLCSLLFIAYLSCATGDVEFRSSEDVAEVDEKAQPLLNRARRQQRSPTDDVLTRGTVHHRGMLTGRRERLQSRRRKKLENASRRGRGGGGRGWRRRVNYHESTSSIATTISTNIDQHISTSSSYVQPVNSHAADLATRGSEVTGVTEDRVVDLNGDILMETISDNGDDMMILVPQNTTMIQFSDISERAVNACRTTQCPRHKVCLLNIQGLPMCRCPSVYHCRGLERRPICTVDGRSYRNKCFLRVDECAANRRMRVQHRGPCRVTAGTGRRVFDAGPDVPPQRRQRQRQRDVVSTERRPPTEYHQHRRRGRIRRRRPRHNPVSH